MSKPLGAPWTDGSSRLVGELVEAFGRSPNASLEYRVFGRPGYGVDGRGIKVDLLEDSRIPRNLRTAFRLFRKSGDLNHFFFAPHPRAVAAARLVSAVAGAETIQTVCSQPKNFQGSANFLFGRRVIVVSRWARKMFMNEGVPERRLRYIPPPMLSITAPSEERRRRARRDFEIEEGAKIVLFAGDASAGGGLATLLEAIPSVVREVPQVVFVISSRPKSEGDEATLRRAKRTLSDAGLSPMTRVVGALSDFQALVASTAVCALPASSLYAKVDYPYAVLEAMSLAVPVVVCRDTAPEELVADGGGFAVSRGNAGSLASALIDLLGDEGKRAAMGAAAHSTVTELCDPGRIGELHEELYLEVLGDRGTRS